jgi:integrase
MATPKERREKGSGGMYRRGKNTWRLVVWDPRAKRQVFRTFKGTDKEARKALANLISDVSKGRVSAKAAGRLTIGELLDEWFAGRRYRSVATRDRDLHSIKRLKEFVGNQRVVDFAAGATEGQRLIVEMERKGYSASSIRNMFGPLRRALDHAVREGYIVANPTRFLDLPSPPTSDQSKAATPAEVATFLEAARAEGEDDFELAAFVAITGMRRGEVVGLMFEDIDLAAGWVEISRVAVHAAPIEQTQPDGSVENVPGGKELRPWGKTPGATRRVRLDEAAIAIVAARRDRRERDLTETEHDPVRQGWGFVFSPDPLGADFYSPYRVTHVFARIRDRLAAESDITPHKFRHYAATQAALAGVPTHEVLAQFGWTSPQMYLHYSRVREARSDAAPRAASAPLAEVLGGTSNVRTLRRRTSAAG